MEILQSKLVAWCLKSFLSSMLIFVAINVSARADAIGYEGVVTLVARTDKVVAEHHHDWSSATRIARWKMISTTENPFTAENDYSVLTLRDKKSGTELFRRPVPALSYIWISPDSKYVVGVSNIMLWNPYQLVIFDKLGNRLLEQNLVFVKWPGVSHGVSNWINWYREPIPKMAIRPNRLNRLAFTLSVEDAAGVLREFEFNVPNSTSTAKQ